MPPAPLGGRQAAGAARNNICKWFNVLMGFGFRSMTAGAGVTLNPGSGHLCALE